MTNNFSLLSLFTGGDIMTLFISLLLVAASVVSWAIIIEKIRLWRGARRNPVRIQPNDNLDLVVDRLIRPYDRNLWFYPCCRMWGRLWGCLGQSGA